MQKKMSMQDSCAILWLEESEFFQHVQPTFQEIEDENDEATPSSSHQVNHSQKHPVLRFGFAASCLRGRHCCCVFVCCVFFFVLFKSRGPQTFW